MKDIIFYEEFKDKRKGISSGNCLAVFGEWFGPMPCKEMIGSLFSAPNSQVCCSSVSRENLQKKCKRISESRARWIHPNLFRHLDKLSVS